MDEKSRRSAEWALLLGGGWFAGAAALFMVATWMFPGVVYDADPLIAMLVCAVVSAVTTLTWAKVRRRFE